MGGPRGSDPEDGVEDMSQERCRAGRARRSGRFPRSGGGVALTIVAGLLFACVDEHSGGEGSLSANPDADTPEVSSVDAPRFRDVAPETGLVFEHDNGMTGARYFVEPVGSGGALADLDGDGDLDVVLVQGGALGEAASPGDADLGGPRVFRNELSHDVEGGRRLSFTDVTAESGLRPFGYGMGVATGDFDNDGRIDLYFTGFGPNRLWRNVGTGDRIAFVDTTAKSGVDDSRWSTSASFVDLDADGWLDLFVVNYVEFRLENHRPCRSAGGRPDYCGPQSYEGEPDRVLLNRGDGTFADITGAAGVLDSPSSGLGLVTADFDGDGRIDVYVANDLRRNFLWRNLGGEDGVPHFENVALESGVAVSMLGRAQASMGVIAEDLDDDGDDDLFMTHLDSDTNTLYLNDGRGVFDDRSTTSGLGAPSLDRTGFGVAAIDFDNDGRLDLAAANGAVKGIEEQVLAGSSYPLAQSNQLFHNRGEGRFVDVTSQGGSDFTRLEVSRGLAVGDVDNDGRSDLLLTNNNGPARLLLNESREANAWLGLRLLEGTGKRDAVGARVGIVRPDGTTLWRRVASDGSYLSARDPRVLVGLGRLAGSVTVEVIWPGGERATYPGLEPGRYHTLVEGKGEGKVEVEREPTAAVGAAGRETEAAP